MIFYIDPGTGSMLFTILIGLAGALVYGIRGLMIKLRWKAGTKKAAEADEDRVPIAIFTDSKRYWNIFEPICDALEEAGQETAYLTMSEDDPALARSYSHIHPRFIGAGNKAFAYMNFLKADLVLSSTPGLDVYQWKRSRDVSWYVHISHGPNDLTMYRMFGLDYYDAVLVSAPYQIEQERRLEAAHHVKPKEYAIVGLPYLDVMRERLAASPAIPPHPTTILLAPSWGKSALFARYGHQIFDSLLKTDYHLIVRPHPQSYISEKAMLEDLKSSYPASDQLEWNHDNDNFESLRRADVIISDFSGILFEFALVHDKPVIYADTHYDKSPYDAAWLDEPLWTFEVLPKIGRKLDAENVDHLDQLVGDVLTNPRYSRGREEARQETWYKQGEGTEAVKQYLLSSLDRLQKTKEEQDSLLK